MAHLCRIRKTEKPFGIKPRNANNVGIGAKASVGGDARGRGRRCGCPRLVIHL